MKTLFEYDNDYDLTKARAQVLEYWESSSRHGLEKNDATLLLPIIKLGEKMTYPPWIGCNSAGLVVKIQDVLVDNGTRTTPIYQAIQRSGGLHNYLDYPGKIVLSSIMPDKTIFGLSIKKHSEIVNTLAPDYHITPDGETYINESNLSSYEIHRMIEWTKYLIENCPKSKPIGLIKGSNLAQIIGHTNDLLDLNVNMFAFHAGDFIFRSNNKSIHRAYDYYAAIRKRVPWLMIYGVGSNKYFGRFCDANCFATQSHFISAFHGQRIGDSGAVSTEDNLSKELICHNLKSIESKIIEIESERIASYHYRMKADETCIENAV